MTLSTFSDQSSFFSSTKEEDIIFLFLFFLHTRAHTRL